jgi:crotonobetainyl-CoA:carnitine CoA-transferase CaiB-like acyl-CoA transferase
VLTGLYASTSVLAALGHRDKDGYRSGLGQHIDLALLDVQVACLANQAMNYLATGVSPQRLGNSHPSIVPYQDFPTSDGYMILAIGNDGQFARFCEAAGCAELATDARFATNKVRVENRTSLIPLLRQKTVFRTTMEWIETLEAVGVPCGPINTLADVFADPQVKARGMRIEMPHRNAGNVSLVGSPIRLSETPVEYRNPPPELGEHTETVLRRVLNMDDRTIAKLKQAKAI